VRDNSIAQNGRFTNDFAINLWGSNQEAYNNTVNVTSGRGIIIDGIVATTTGVSAHDNDIIVTELPQNQEYGGCQLGGAYGIQFDDAGGGAVHHNKVLAKADQCAAKGLRITRVGSGSSSHENLFAARRIGDSAAIAAGFSTGGGKDFSSWSDTFVADTYNIELDWDGGRNLIFQNDTFVKGENPAPNYATFSFRNAGNVDVSDIRFIDCSFLNGASKESSDMQSVNANNWPGPSEYFIEWTLTVAVKDNEGNNVSDASIVISDARNIQVFKGTTRANGMLSTVLTEFRRYNTFGGVFTEMRTPHLLTVGRNGCSTDRFSLSITGKTHFAAKLNCQ
jgi:hypothetical protein